MPEHTLTPTRLAVLGSYVGQPQLADQISPLNRSKAEKWLTEQGFLRPSKGAQAFTATAAGLKAYAVPAAVADVKVIEKVQAARRRHALAWATAEIHTEPAPPPNNHRTPVVGELVEPPWDAKPLFGDHFQVIQVKRLERITVAYLRQLNGHSFPAVPLSRVRLVEVHAGPEALYPTAVAR